MSDYLLQHGTRTTPQREQARGDQTPNSSGGYVWAVDMWTRLRRFLILGSEGGSYYASERDLTTQNVKCVRECVTEDGVRTVNEIVDVSQWGRAPKNDPALYALAVCISQGDKATRSAAAEALPQVARIGTHLYHFVAYVETMRGWGRTLRWAVGNWYDRAPDRLAYDAVKYRQRDEWSHRDLLRLAHPHGDLALDNVLDWIVGRGNDVEKPRILEGFERAQLAKTPAETAALVTEYGLPREALNTDHLTDPQVWAAMLDSGMPIGALIRNLATMTRIGLLTPTSADTKTVLAALGDGERVLKGRIHPLNVLFGLATYASGRGFRGTNTWMPVPQVVDALDGTFYLAFGNVEPTGKRILLALDVSGSMTGGHVGGVPLSPRECAAAMALITAKTEPLYDVVAFAAGTGFWESPYKGPYVGYSHGLTPFPLSPRQRLDDVVAAMHGLPFGGTDCSLPMLYASDKGIEYDAFVIYTDSETWHGPIHPFQALREYRARVVPDAKLVVVGMVANGFSIADPTDAGMMDVVGMDTATPGVISEFVAGRL